MTIRPLITAIEASQLTGGFLNYKRLRAAKRGERPKFGSLDIPTPISTSGRCVWYKLTDVLAFMEMCGVTVTQKDASKLLEDRRTNGREEPNEAATNSTDRQGISS